MRSTRLLLPGIVLLALSLLTTLSLEGGDSTQAALARSWLGQVGLFIGSGLVVAGAVLRVLDTPSPGMPQHVERLDHRD